jgi:hypothetical protein
LTAGRAGDYWPAGSTRRERPRAAKLKALLRDAAERTTEALWAAVGRLLGRFTPAECARYLAHCGYGQSG